MKKYLVFILFLIYFWNIVKTEASNFVLPYSSVNNKKLEYSTDTKYVDELNFAVNLWNSENKVSIVKLPWVKTGDLYITDNYADFKDWA